MRELVRLKNRLQLAAVNMPLRDSVAVGVWIKVGGRYESRRVSGISHFIEHLLFKGTRKRSARKIKETVEGLGGAFNAFTSEESTCYFIKILKNHMALALDILSDMVREPLFRKEDIEKERAVIIEEIRMYRDLPSHYVHDIINELLWPNQSLGRQLIGTEKNLRGIKRQDIVRYKDEYYHAGNMLVAICGETEHDEAFRQTMRFFSDFPKRKASSFSKAYAKQRKPQFDIRGKDTEQTHFVIGIHGLSRRDPRRFQLSLLNIILGANMSSRLYEEVREKRGLAYEIKSNVGYHQDAGFFTISAGVEPHKASFALKVILNQMRKLKSHLVSKDELRRAKDYFKGHLYLVLEDTLDRMVWLGERAMYTEEIPSREQIAQDVEKVTAEDIKTLCDKLFRTAHLNLALIGPVNDKSEGAIRRNFYL